MLNYQALKFYPELSDARIAGANKVLGNKVVKRILSFAFYLLGARRRHIAKLLDMPQDTLKSAINRVLKVGIGAFEDSRKKASSFIPQGAAILPKKPSVFLEGEEVIAHFGLRDIILRIPAKNALQVKTILLTMVNNRLITIAEAANILGYSLVHISRLSQALREEDVHALIDKRQGQKQDYLFSPEIKAELVQQFAANAVTGKQTSSRIITEQLKKRCNLNLPDRSVRLHIKKLGLPRIAKSLPGLVEALKKTPDNIAQQDE